MWMTNCFLHSQPQDVKQNNISKFEVILRYRCLFLDKLMNKLGYSEHFLISTMYMAYSA